MARMVNVRFQVDQLQRQLCLGPVDRLDLIAQLESIKSKLDRALLEPVNDDGETTVRSAGLTLVTPPVSLASTSQPPEEST